MQAAADASSSGMVAIIGLDIPSVEKICEEATKKSGKPIQIANYLVDGNYAISGAKEACDAAREIAPEMGTYYIYSMTCNTSSSTCKCPYT
jgi:[acyl-carrier-protein] S-malonyltransferase